MPSETPQSTGFVTPLVRVGDPNKPTIYCNNIVLAVTQWDVQMYITTVQETEPGKFMAVDKALVIMTPEHAMKFSEVLKTALENYASANGPIREIKQVTLPK
jgi:hypothetical protein